MRRGLFQHHRHADRAASADAIDAQIRSQDLADRLRLSDQDPHPHQARLQESRNTSPPCGCRTTTPAAIGKTRATTGSPGSKNTAAAPAPCQPRFGPLAIAASVTRRIFHAHFQSSSARRRRHRPRSHGRGEAAARLLCQERHRRFSDRGRLGRRRLLRRAQGRHHRCDHGQGACRRRGDFRRGRRTEMGQGAVRGAAGSGAVAAAQGAWPVRQYPAGDRLSGAGRRFEPQARGGRGPRHHHPARAHRRRLFRRAEDHHRSRQRPEARRSIPRSTTPTRSSASRGWLSNWRASGATRSPRWKSAT